MKNEKTVDVLNKLLEINNERVEGYETALKETDESDLKTLFAKLARTSSKFVTELTDEIRSMNGKPVEGTMISGKFFRAWMDVKAALTGRDRKAILSSCEFGEDKAMETYEKVLRDDLNNLSAIQQDLIIAQFSLIKADHDKVHYLRDSYSRKSDSGDVQRKSASM